ncbi:MAG: 2'-5' RNA ligase family protein [Cyclobacteriaceae bacterium]|nr:2'-5' RNA ligase family protein [Cyclobacteriaceae bacterium]
METKVSPELLFIISPPPAIAEYVSMLKQHVKLAIGHPFEDEFTKAHISLFKYRDEHAEDWLYQVDSKISSFAPFHVHIKNLNFYDHGTTRTIYLEVVQKTPIYELVEKLDHSGDFTPYITIARNLDINDFLKAWKSLKNLSYSDYFRCDHITVLKKAPRRWVHYMDLGFAA